MASRLAHNQENVGSSPTSATKHFTGRLMVGREVLALEMLVRVQPGDPNNGAVAEMD